MKKDDDKTVDIYEDFISIEDRIILLITGIFSFPVGFFLYFYFDKKDKNKEKFIYHSKFAKEGAWCGFILTLLMIISFLMFGLAEYFIF